MLFGVLPYGMMLAGCKPAEEGSPQYAGRGTKPEVSVFGTFNGCTFEAAADYPPNTISNIADFTPSAYPPDSGTACSPTGGGKGCYMQTPESIRGKGVVNFL